MIIPSDLRVTLQQRRPIPLEVELGCGAGEVLALVGPSGSGKSTVLRCIAGLHKPTEGNVVCRGQTWLDTGRNVYLPPQARRVGMVFQSYALFPHMTAAQNVATALGHLPASARNARAWELLARVHLDGLQDRYPNTLSGGQQQRVALARALARDPVALLLDEPFSAVDQVTRRKLRFELASLTRTLDMPIVLVTHDLDEARMLANRLCVMHAGRTLQTGTPEHITQYPLNATIARLMDMVNVFEGRILEHLPNRGLTRLNWYEHLLEVPLDDTLAPHSRVHWMIPPGGVLLHRRDRPPSRGEQENPLSGHIVEIFNSGPLSTVITRVTDTEGESLTLELPPHVVKRNRLATGDRIGFSLVGETIHMMPWQSDLRERRSEQGSRRYGDCRKSM